MRSVVSWSVPGPVPAENQNEGGPAHTFAHLIAMLCLFTVFNLTAHLVVDAFCVRCSTPGVRPCGSGFECSSQTDEDSTPCGLHCCCALPSAIRVSVPSALAVAVSIPSALVPSPFFRPPVEPPELP